jgi:hypothetical protein
MAKPARGRTVLGVNARGASADQLQAAHDRYEASYKADYVAGTSPALTTWERTTRRLMSDGKILEKRDVRFQPDWLDTDGRRHSYGWKVHGTIKAGVTTERFVEIYSGPTKSGKPSPWTVRQDGKTVDETGSTGFHKRITLTRVTNAVKRSC